MMSTYRVPGLPSLVFSSGNYGVLVCLRVPAHTTLEVCVIERSMS